MQGPPSHTKSAGLFFHTKNHQKLVLTQAACMPKRSYSPFVGSARCVGRVDITAGDSGHTTPPTATSTSASIPTSISQYRIRHGNNQHRSRGGLLACAYH
jgi:hypothetical protein